MNPPQVSEIWEKLYQQGWGGAWPREEVVRWAVRCCPDRSLRAQRRVLDIGCGNGRHLWMLAVEGFQVLGFDPSPSAVRLCREMVSRQDLAARAEVLDGGLELLTRLPGPFDMALDSTTLCSVGSRDRKQAHRRVAELLTKEGSYFTIAFGKATTGFGAGRLIEVDTYDQIPDGPLANRGLAAFHDRDTLSAELGQNGLIVRALDSTVFTTQGNSVVVELLMAECGKHV